MKKIRLLSLFLAILMLMGSAVLLVSCAEKHTPGEIALSKKTVELDMTGYTVLYGKSQSEESFTTTFRDQFNLFVSRLSEATGANFKLKEAARTDADPDTKAD